MYWNRCAFATCFKVFFNARSPQLILCFFPPDIKGEGVELVIQGFDIDPMEARLILGGKNDSSDFSDILDGIGGSSIGAEALKALAEGFESRRGNVIKAVG